MVVLVDGREVLGRHVLREYYIFDAHSHSVERTSLVGWDGIEGSSRFENDFWVEVCPASDMFVVSGSVGWPSRRDKARHTSL